jgi:hypothetical protein
MVLSGSFVLDIPFWGLVQSLGSKQTKSCLIGFIALLLPGVSFLEHLPGQDAILKALAQSYFSSFSL